MRDRMFVRFAAYGFLKNLRLFEPFLLLYFREHFSFFRIGVLYALREASTNLLEVPTGVLADRIGRRRTMVLSMVSYLLSFFVFFFTRNFWAYAAAMVLFGAGEALRSGTHKALILSYLRARGMENQKVAYYGATRSWSQRGSALNAILSGILVLSTREYRWVFAASMIPYGLNLLNLATYPAWLDERIVRQGGRKTLRTFRQMFRPDFLRSLGNSGLFMGLFRASKDYLQPMLKVLALSLPVLVTLSAERRTAVVVAGVYTGIYLLNAWASRNAHRLVRTGSLAPTLNGTYLLGGLVVMASGLALSWGWNGLAVLLFVGLYLLQNLRRPITMGYFSDLVPEAAMATALSVESNVRTLFAAFLAPLLGFLADRFGVGGALMGVGGLAVALFPLVRVRPVAVKSEAVG